MSKPLTQAQLEARSKGGKARAAQFTPEYQSRAALALSSRVDRQYYRFIGRRGGRKALFNLLIEISETYTCRSCQEGNCKLVTKNPAGHERLVEEMKAHYRDEAFEKYWVEGLGTRVMLELFRPERLDCPAPGRRRRSKKAKARRIECQLELTM